MLVGDLTRWQGCSMRKRPVVPVLCLSFQKHYKYNNSPNLTVITLPLRTLNPVHALVSKVHDKRNYRRVADVIFHGYSSSDSRQHSLLCQWHLTKHVENQRFVLTDHGKTRRLKLS